MPSKGGLPPGFLNRGYTTPRRGIGRSAASSPSRTHRAASLRSSRFFTVGHIARLRAILKLTPAQQPHWLPVEVALSDLARQQARGLSIAATTMHLRRIKSIAMPLIMTLDDNQKRDAIAFSRTMGFQQLVAAF